MRRGRHLTFYTQPNIKAVPFLFTFGQTDESMRIINVCVRCLNGKVIVLCIGTNEDERKRKRRRKKLAKIKTRMLGKHMNGTRTHSHIRRMSPFKKCMDFRFCAEK